MENKKFTEREELEKKIKEQEYEINLLRQSRTFDRYMDLIGNAIALVLLIASEIICITTKFKYDSFVTFSISLCIGMFIYGTINSYNRLKKKNEDNISDAMIMMLPKLVKDISTGSLKLRLSKAVDNENYDLAIIIRDELKKRIL